MSEKVIPPIPPVPSDDGQEEPAPGFSLPLRDCDLPPVIKQIVTNAPKSRKLQSFIASLAPLCALATRIRLKYCYDTRISSLLLQVLIEGKQSSGKSFAANIEHLIMDRTTRVRDMVQRRKEQKYKDDKKRRRANERLEEEPHTVIVGIPPTISKTVIVKRADAFIRYLGDTLTFWMFAEELAQVTDAGRNGYSNLRTIMRNAYDLGSLFGMDFASDNSYSAIVDINICSMFCTTPYALDRYMDKDSIEGGNMTRCILTQINDPIGAPAAIFQPYTDDQMKVINSTLDRIMADTYTPDGTLQPQHFLDMSWIDRDVKTWCEEKGEEAMNSRSDCLNIFHRRASASAFRVTSLCYYLYQLGGMKEDKAQRFCKRIYEFMAEYILQTLLDRWGDRYIEYTKDKQDTSFSLRFPKLYNALGENITRKQLEEEIRKQGNCTRIRQVIYLWKESGHIVVIDKHHFKKVKRR